jgi:hypothetical protein
VTVAAFDRTIERSCIGAVLSAGSYSARGGWKILDRAKLAGLTVECFYVRSLGILWAELERLRAADVPLDPSPSPSSSNELWSNGSVRSASSSALTSRLFAHT